MAAGALGGGGRGGAAGVDRLATAALREAARRKKRLVERDVLARVLDASRDEERAA